MAHDHPAPRRQQSGLEMLLAPVMGGAFFLYAMFQARRAPAVKPTPHRVAPEHSEVELTGWQAKLGHIPVIGAALRVNKRYGEFKGNNLAAAVAFQMFVSLFPLLLVVVAVVGLFARSDSTVAGDIIGKLGLQGDAARLLNDGIDTAAKNPGATGPIATWPLHIRVAVAFRSMSLSSMMKPRLASRPCASVPSVPDRNRSALSTSRMPPDGTGVSRASRSEQTIPLPAKEALEPEAPFEVVPVIVMVNACARSHSPPIICSRVSRHCSGESTCSRRGSTAKSCSSAAR